jgi:hypothetical protein
MDGSQAQVETQKKACSDAALPIGFFVYVFEMLLHRSEFTANLHIA